MGRAAKAIGAIPTTMPASETTLHCSVVLLTHGFRMPTPSQRTSYEVLTGTRQTCHWVSELSIVFNIDSYNALPAQYKALEDVKDGSYAAQGAPMQQRIKLT